MGGRGGDTSCASRGEEDDGPPLVPDTIAGGAFRIEGQLGAGSYGVVHRGVHEETGDEVAVKFEWTESEKGNKLLAEARLGEGAGVGMCLCVCV